MTGQANTGPPKPIICTFRQLAYAMRSLHQGDKRRISDLHDVWMKGAPSPSSRILNPRGYDPRKSQAGNHEARIVFPTLLEKWIRENAASIGIGMTSSEARRVLDSVATAFSTDRPK